MGIIGTIAMVILAPIAAMLVQMAISRTREYAADRMGAQIAGEPMWLVSGLQRIEHAAHQIPNEAAEHNPATAHMFIINPLSGQPDGQPVLDPSGDGKSRRRADAAGRRNGPHRLWPRRPTRPAAPAHGAARGPWGGGARRGPWG